MRTGISIVVRIGGVLIVAMIALVLLSRVVLSSLSDKCFGGKYIEGVALKCYGNIWGLGNPWLVFQIEKNNFYQFYSSQLFVPANSDEIVMLEEAMVGSAKSHRFIQWEKCLLDCGDILYMSHYENHVEGLDEIQVCFVVFSI